MIFSNIFSLINHKRLLVSFLVLLFSFFFTLKQTNAQENGKYKMKTVVIDAGHGGKDPGAVCKKGYEKDIALNIALKLGHYIDSLIDGVKVIYTRDKDEFIELHKRAKIANDAKADLFISIHINANRSSKPIGTETYVMGIHRTKENLAVAQLENSVILKEDNYEAQYDGFDPNSTEGYIIFSLMQNLYLEQSLSFAANVQKQFETRAMRINRGVKQAGFLVLWKTTMPSVLIETGFLSNPDEAAYLLSVSGQDYLASAIFRAFRDYKNDLEETTKESIKNHNNEEIKHENKPIKDTVEKNTNKETGENNKTQQKAENKEAKKEDKNSENSDKDSVILYNNLVFKIQIASSDIPVLTIPDNFKGLDNIEEYKENNKYKYFAKSVTDYKEAIQVQKDIRKLYPDAFVVAFKNGKKIPLKDALNE